MHTGAVLLVLLVMGCSQPLEVAVPLLLEEGFENKQTLYDAEWWGRSGNDNGRISHEVAREGEASARFEVALTEDGDFRSEVASGKNHPCLRHYLIGEEYWYGISILPDASLSVSPYEEIVFQFHSTPDNVPGETWTTGLNPPVALSSDGEKWEVSIRGDDKPVSKRGEYLFSTREYLGRVEKGKWTDWVFHIKWNYDGNGYTQIWKDGEMVLNLTGPNCFNDKVGPYLKFGVYAWYLKDPSKGTWKKAKEMAVGKRIYYHDAVRIADENGSFGMVAPKGVEASLKVLEPVNWKSISEHAGK